MESITQMYKISQLAKPKTCALGWLPFFLSELPDIGGRIDWLHQAQDSELDKLKEINVPVEEIDIIRYECSLLVRFYRRLKMLMLQNSAKPHVIKMSGYFIQYLAHYIQQKQASKSTPSTTIVNVQSGATYNDIHDNTNLNIH